MILEQIPVQTMLGTVVGIDEQHRVCDVEIDEGYVLYGVRLTPVDSSPCYMVPTKGSWVVVASIENSESLYVVVMTSRIDTLVADIGGATLEIREGKATIRGGEYGGIVKVGELVGRLNTLEQALNDLKQILTSWTPATGDGGAALKTAVTDWAAARLTETKRENIENENITHG
ncbi:MAG: hypothetical protein IJC16_00205 [Rikenellaceae bacterium]|nr:hypothetical protein [Rikenellaceae bacterium]